jgi:DNA-binding SARP family transcriptional activator/Tfp pilus assembly protein PilF
MFPKIRISTFGALQVQRGDYLVSEADWHTRQARQLLKILLTERPRALSADRLIEILWPNSTPAAAATTLRSAINALRNVLEPERPNRAPSRYILTQAPGYAFHLHPDIWLDVELFQKELELSRQAHTHAERILHLRQALALYVDDYLTSDPYADWVRVERERLQELYFGAVLQLAELQAATGQHEEAIAATRQLLARDPVRETAYQALMRFQAATGDSAAALLTFERCRNLLSEELGADPSPATQLLHQRILNGDIEAPGPRPSYSLPPVTATHWPQVVLLPHHDDATSPPFVGHSAELAQLQADFDRARRGQGRLILLEGEAGIGKSRLAHQLLLHAAAAEASIIGGVCSALEQNMPFAPLVDLLDRYFQKLAPTDLATLPAATLSQIAQLLPALRDRAPELDAPPQFSTLDAAEHRLRLIEALANIFSALAQRRPHLLFLDDLQWVDRETLSVLRRLAQRANELPLLILLAHRPEQRSEHPELDLFHRALRHDQIGTLLPVPPLTAADVRQLIDAQADSLPPDLLQNLDQTAGDLHKITGGNALFVAEILHERRTVAQGAYAGSAGVAIYQSERIQAIILARTKALPAAAQSLLQLAAVIARPFSLDLLEAAAHEDPLAPLDSLLQAHLLVELPNARLAFAHELVRQVIYADINPLQRRRLHLQIAQALEAQTPRRVPASELAHHYHQAGATHQLAFARYSIEAGNQLLQNLGFDQALAQFDAALATLAPLVDSPPDLTRQALQGRGLAQESLLDVAGVAETYGRLQAWAVAQGDFARLIATHSRYSSTLTLLGNPRRGHELVAELYATLQGTSPAQQAHWQAATHLFADLVTRRHCIHRIDPTPPADGWTPYRLPTAAIADPRQALLTLLEPTYALQPLFDYGWTLLAQGQIGEATHCLEQAIDLAETTAQPSVAAAAYHQLAITARVMGDRDHHAQLLDQSLALSQAAGSSGELAALLPRLTRADLALDEGALDDAAQQFQAILNDLDAYTGFQHIRHSANIGLGLVALAQGATTVAQAQLETAVGDPFHIMPYSHVRAWIGLAHLAHAQDHPAECRHALRRALLFAGERSLLEEYHLAVIATAQLLPQSAPVEALIESVLGYVQTIRLFAAETRLLDARRQLRKARRH